MKEANNDLDPVIVLASELMLYGHRFARKAADAELSKIGLGRAHFRALHMIRHHQGIMTNQLLRQLEIKAASLTRVMKELISQGYVAQETDIEDRRLRHHYLTEKGDKLYAEIFLIQQRVFKSAFDTAGEEAVKNFLTVLHLMLPEESADLLSTPFPY